MSRPTTVASEISFRFLFTLEISRDPFSGPLGAYTRVNSHGQMSPEELSLLATVRIQNSTHVLYIYVRNLRPVACTIKDRRTDVTYLVDAVLSGLSREYRGDHVLGHVQKPKAVIKLARASLPRRGGLYFYRRDRADERPAKGSLEELSKCQLWTCLHTISRLAGRSPQNRVPARAVSAEERTTDVRQC